MGLPKLGRVGLPKLAGALGRVMPALKGVVEEATTSRLNGALKQFLPEVGATFGG